MADNDVPSLYPGAVLTGRRRYVIERVLGAGGFGITYCASTDITVDNITVTARMAVKEHFVSLYNERADNNVTVTTPGSQKVRELVANSMRDFLGEARRLQRLGAGHPNIVKVNEVFEANGTAYYVMEYLDGSSLWDNIKDRGMTEPDMLALMLPIVDAVAYLHRNRLTHLDIKPQNIMLAAGEGGAVRPVLIDFGLSKHYDAEGHATSTINTLACSDGYSPAEQYSGIMTFTPSADVYALGATMIACLTGKTPPKSTEWTAGERMRYIDTLPVSEPLSAALRGALADTSQRLPDASALANILTDSATRPVEGRFLSKDSALRFPTSPSPRMESSNDTRPVERQYSTAGPSPVNSTGATRLASSWRKPGINNSLPIILIALAAVAIGIGAYFAFRSGNNPQPLPSPADTLAIAQTLETDPVAVDNSAAEAAAAAEAERQRLAEQERQRQEEAERQRLAEQERQRQEEAERQRLAEQERQRQEEAERQRLAEQERQRQEEAERQRREEEQRRQVWQNHRTPRNLYLAVNRGGNQYYFSESDWNALPAAQKGECSKLGVVINKDGERFILALEDAPGFYSWHGAMNRFGNRLPTKQQGEAWISQQEAVQSAIRAFGGHITGKGVYDHNYTSSDSRHYNWYWTRTPYESVSSSAWHVGIASGNIGHYPKTHASRVRVVAPVSVSSAI